MSNLLTVAEALEIPEIKQGGLYLVAGHTGQHRPVRWAHVVEVPEPPAWLRPGDLLLTTGMSLPSEMKDRVALVRRLYDMGVAGIVFAPGLFWQAIPEDICLTAEEVGLPLIICPWDTRFVDVTEALHREILRGQYALLDQLYLLHRQITFTAVSSQSLEDIAEVLGRFTQQPVVILDPAFRLLAHWEGAGHLDEARRQTLESGRPSQQAMEWFQNQVSSGWLHHHGGARRIPGDEERGLFGRIVCPIVASGELLGSVWIVDSAGTLSDLHVQAAEQAAMVAALLILRQRALTEAEERAGFSLVDSLLQGSPSIDGIWIDRLRLRGFDPEKPYVVFVTVASNPDPQLEEGRAVKTAAWITHAVRSYMQQKGYAPLLTVHLHAVVGLLPVNPHDHRTQLVSFLQGLHKHLKSQGFPTRLGAGSVALAPDELRISWQHAQWALDFAYPSEICWYEELNTLKILESTDPKTLRELYQSTLGQLAQRDPDLVATAVALVDRNFNFRQVARDLYLHRNSISYRVGLIEKICGQSLEDPRFRLKLQLAREVERLRHNPSFCRRLGIE